MTIPELRRRSNDFVANLDTHIAAVVNFNEKLEELNRKQLRESKLADGKPIGKYRRGYAIWKAHYYPQSYTGPDVNMLLTGRLHKSLDLRVRGREYSITTDVPYALDLAMKYGDFTGISPENQPEAQRITGGLLGEKYKQLVLK